MPKEAIQISAYNMKLKKTEVIKDVVITKTKNGRYFAKGIGSNGGKCCVALGEEKALDAIKAGIAKKDF